MKFMLMIMGDEATYEEMSGRTADSRWTEEHLRAMYAHMGALNEELARNGEMLDGQGLTAPSEARVVTAEDGGPHVTDHPYGRSQEALAGYWLIDVASSERAIEIAARVHSCPVPEGVVGSPVVVRPVQEGPGA